MKPPNSKLSRYGTTIFDVMSRLAREHQAINLGQGLPEDGEPADIIAFAAKAGAERGNQYPPMMGLPELRQAVAAHDRTFYGLDLEWQTQTMVVSGGTEALAASLLALIEPGDEVVVIEPLYDTYLPIIELAGGIAKIVRLSPPEWNLPLDALAAAFGLRTKLILFNTPMNPTGKVFSDTELTAIAELMTRHDCYAICDEVYEHLVFDGLSHHPLLTFPGMENRAIRIASAGKTFSLTGWKVGYISACAGLIAAIAKAHQFLVFTTPPNLQAAIAFGLNKERAFFEGLGIRMQAKRDRLSAGLEAAGFDVAHTAGTFFVTADIGSVGYVGDDVEFCREIIETAGVAAIPISAFYISEPPRNFVRFCFAKRDEALDEAATRLKRKFGK